MTTYTTPHSLPIIEPTVDRIKDGSEASALAGDINQLAHATNAAIEGAIVVASPFKGDLAAGTDMNTLTTPQDFTISQGALWDTITNLPPGLPTSAGWGSVRRTINNLIELRVSTYGVDAQEWWKVTVNAGTGAFGPWRRKDVDKITAPYSGLANSVRLSEFLTKIGGTKFTNGIGAVAIRYDHGLANLKTKIQPLHSARNLPFLVAINSRSWALAENTGCTISDVQSWVTAGLASLGNHGALHTDATTTAALTDTIVGGLTELQAQFPTAYIPGFIVPGVGGTNYNGFNSGTTPDNFYNTTAGRLILENHAVSTGAFPGTGRRVLDGKVRQGQAHFSMEAQTYATIKAQIDLAKTEKTGLQLFMHPSLLDTPGYMTTAILTQVLDYIVAERDAGRLAVMTPYELLLADSATATSTALGTLPARVTAVETKNTAQDTSIAALQGREWRRGALASLTDLDTVKTPGTYQLYLTNYPNMPYPVGSYLEVLPMGSNGTTPTLFLQRVTTNEVVPRKAERITSVGGWWPWVYPAAPPATTVDAGIHQHTMRLNNLRHRLGPVSTGGKGAVALVFDHGTNNFKDVVLPALVSRSMRATLALNSQMYDPAATRYATDNATTWTMIKGWHDTNGIEIANHGRKHIGPAIYADMVTEVKGGREELETNLPGVFIDSWVQTGNPQPSFGGFNDGATVAGYWTTDAGRVIIDNHAVVTGQVPGTRYYPIDGEPVIGMMGNWIDTAAGITATKNAITSAGATGRATLVRAHPELLNTAGYTTTAELAAFLDWLAARTDVVILPLRELAIARK